MTREYTVGAPLHAHRWFKDLLEELAIQLFVPRWVGRILRLDLPQEPKL